MGLKKGQTNNPAGRPNGTPNRTTQEIRQLIIDFVNNNIDDMQAVYNTLEPDKKLLMLEKMIKYIVPPAKENDLNASDSININFINASKDPFARMRENAGID